MTKKEIKIISEAISKVVANRQDSDDFWATVKAFTHLRHELIKNGIELDIINYKIK